MLSSNTSFVQRQTLGLLADSEVYSLLQEHTFEVFEDKKHLKKFADMRLQTMLCSQHCRDDIQSLKLHINQVKY